MLANRLLLSRKSKLNYQLPVVFDFRQLVSQRSSSNPNSLQPSYPEYNTNRANQVKVIPEVVLGLELGLK